MLLLEGIDKASTAVLERLNPLLEADRRLVVHEDLTCEHRHINIPRNLAIVATISCNEMETLRVSPALSSRMTVIRVQPYDLEDLQLVVEGVLSDCNFAN